MVPCSSKIVTCMLLLVDLASIEQLPQIDRHTHIYIFYDLCLIRADSWLSWLDKLHCMLMVCIAFVTGPWPGCLCSLDRGLAGCFHWTVAWLVVFTGPWSGWLCSLDRDQAGCAHWTVYCITVKLSVFICLQFIIFVIQNNWSLTLHCYSRDVI